MTPRPVLFFHSAAGRSQPLEFLAGLGTKDRAAILEDLRTLAALGRAAPVSVKPTKGGRVRGLMEIRTREFRTFWCLTREALCVPHVCRKGAQAAGIDAARARLALLGEDLP